MSKGERGAELTENGVYQSKARASLKYNKTKKKIMVRMDEQAKEQLDKYAADHRMSLNELVLKALEEKTGLDLL